jgi:hypothetical protein
MSRTGARTTTSLKLKKGAGSARPSEERSTPVQLAGKKRVRDADTERVSSFFHIIVLCFRGTNSLCHSKHFSLTLIAITFFLKATRKLPRVPRRYREVATRARDLPLSLGSSLAFYRPWLRYLAPIKCTTQDFFNLKVFFVPGSLLTTDAAPITSKKRVRDAIHFEGNMDWEMANIFDYRSTSGAKSRRSACPSLTFSRASLWTTGRT